MITARICLLVILLVVLALAYFYVKGYKIEKADEKAIEAEKDLIKTLTSLTKADYDFFVANDVELPQAVHDHFNPKAKAIEYDPVLDAFRVPRSWIQTETIGKPILRRRSRAERGN